MAILFGSDWTKHSFAIADTQTKNQSFVRLASVYRLMGIKNHAFILALHNPNLQGVDPFDPDLTAEQMAMIALEAKENPWYCLRELLRAAPLSGADGVPVVANRGIIALWWSFFVHAQIILIQPRQTGKSFGADGLMAVLLNIMGVKTHINLMTKDDNLRRKNIQRIKDIIAELPSYLITMTKADANNGEEITVDQLGNTFSTHVPQASKKRALNMGRGLTSPIFLIDEGPFQVNLETALPAALASTGAAMERARELDAPHGVIFTTTAGKRDDPDGRYFYKLLMESAVWTEKFFDIENIEKLRETICAMTKRGDYRIAAVFNHRMLGKSDDWLRQRIREALSEGEDAERDYLNRWTSGNESHPLSQEVLDRINKSIEEVVFTQFFDKYPYVVRWYKEEHEVMRKLNEGTVLVGIDTSDAGGGDDIGLVFTDASTGGTLGGATINETNLIKVAQWFVHLLETYPRLFMIPERRSSAITIIDYLLLFLPEKGIDPFKRIYNRLVHESEERHEQFLEISRPMNRRDVNVYVRYKKEFGFATSSSGINARSELYGKCLRMATNRCGALVKDRVLIGQVNTLTMKNGRVDHEDGAHDDMIIGWLLTHWFMTSARGMAYYDIDSRIFYSSLVITQDMDYGERNKAMEQIHIRRRIEEIYDELINTSDEVIVMKLEHELMLLDRRIVLRNDDVYSIDDILRQTREARKNSKFRRRLQR